MPQCKANAKPDKEMKVSGEINTASVWNKV